MTERLRALADQEAEAIAQWRKANRPKRGEGPKPLPPTLQGVPALHWLRRYRTGLSRGLPVLLRALGRAMAPPEQARAWKRARAMVRQAGQVQLGQVLLEAAELRWNSAD